MENSSKPRKIATVLVDNYVDDVDRTVNMHKTARNNYAHVYMTLPMPIFRILHALLERIS